MPYKHVRIAGTRRQVGQALGKLARPLMSAYLDQSETWETLRPWRGHPWTRWRRRPGGAASGMGRIRRAGRGPGHAAGRRAPVELSRRPAAQDHRRLHLGGPEVGGWHALDRPQRRWRPLSVWPLPPVDVALDDAPGYLGFYYPGSCPAIPSAPIAPDWSRPSTTCARANGTKACRACSWRAALDCATLDEAVQLLRATPCAGAFITRWARRRTPGCSASKCCPAMSLYRKSARATATPTT